MKLHNCTYLGVDDWEERGLQEIYKETAENLHLTMRYLLWRADKLPTRQQSLKECNDLLDLSNSMELPFHIIGQEPAVYLTTSFIRNYLVASIDIYISRVLLLTGSPGHGKSEMITQIRDHFKIKACELDCGGFQSIFEKLRMMWRWPLSMPHLDRKSKCISNLLLAHSNRIWWLWIPCTKV